MDLREEYKKSMESSSPDREAMDRMKAAVLAKIAAGEGEPGIPEVNKGRKPLPLRRIAYVGGAAAACAVIAVSAATIIPNIKGANDMVTAGESSSAASIQESAGVDTTGNTGAEVAGDAAATVDTIPGEIQSDTKATDCTASDSIAITWEGSLDDNMPNPEAGYDPEDGQTAEELPDGDIDVMPDMRPNTGADTTPNKGSTTPEEPPVSDEPDNSASDSITGLPDKGYTGDAWGFGSAEICATVEPDTSDMPNPGFAGDPTVSTGEYAWEETEELDMTLEDDEALDTEEAVPEREITIVFSGGDWVSYAGEKYTLCKRKPPEGTPVSAVDPVTRMHYNVVQSGSTIAVYQSGKLVGVYKK